MGRPSKFKEEHMKKIKKMALAGFTDKEMAESGDNGGRWKGAASGDRNAAGRDNIAGAIEYLSPLCGGSVV